MAMSPGYALTQVFIPNLLRLKGVDTVVGVIERKEKFFFDTLWNQAHVTHAPFLTAQVRAGYRIGVLSLPAPTEMGEAYFLAVAIRSGDSGGGRSFTLEHDFVLATRANRTQVCERDGQRHIKHGEGPPITGDAEVDAAAFIDAVQAVLAPPPAPRPG